MADWTTPVELTQSRDKALMYLSQVHQNLATLKGNIANWLTWYVKVKQAVDAGELELKQGEAVKYLAQYNALKTLSEFLSAGFDCPHCAVLIEGMEL